MKILYSHYLTDDDHPAARMVHTVAGELRQLGHDVEIHRSSGPMMPRSTGGSAHRSKWKSRLWFAKAMARNRGMLRRDRDAIARFQPDVVLCRQDAYCVSMPAACRKTGVPLVTYADAPVAYESRHYDFTGRWHPPVLVEQLERWGLSQSRNIVTVSQPAEEILNRYRTGVPVHVIPNGVDLNRFLPVSKADRIQHRKSLGIQTPFVAGFIGSFRPFHGLDILGNLIRNSRNRLDLTWVLAGDGPGLPQLKEAAGDNPRVVFLGKRPQAEIPSLLGLMDVMVAPQARSKSAFYFCPLKILEGMAAGLPVLASDQGDIPQIVENGVSGQLVASDEPADWSNALSAMLDSPSRLRGYSESALAKVENYSWSETARRVERVLQDTAHQNVTASKYGTAFAKTSITRLLQPRKPVVNS